MTSEIYITQLIYIKEGQEEAFHQFEHIAIPAIARYKGCLLLRCRPNTDSFIELNMEKPYEIHLVKFESQQDFDNFKNDKERQEFLHLKEQSIRSAVLIQGTKL